MRPQDNRSHADPKELIKTRLRLQDELADNSKGEAVKQKLKEGWENHPEPVVEKPKEEKVKGLKRNNIGVMTLYDSKGKQISDELLKEMQEWVLTYRSQYETKRLEDADPDNPGYKKDGTELGPVLTQQQALNAVCKHFNVKIEQKRQKGKPRQLKGTNYTPPKKKRK